MARSSDLDVIFDLGPLGNEYAGPLQYMLDLARAWARRFPDDNLLLRVQTDAAKSLAEAAGLRCEVQPGVVANKLGFSQLATRTELLISASPTVAGAYGPTPPDAVVCYDFRHIAKPSSFSLSTRLFRAVTWGRSFRRSPVVLSISDDTTNALKGMVGRNGPTFTVGIEPSITGVRPGSIEFSEREGIFAVCHRENKPPQRALRLWQAAFEEGRRPPITLLTGDMDVGPATQPEVEVVRRLNRERYEQALRSSRILLFATDHEGLGLPVIEAMAAGTPVLSSDLPSIRMLVGRDYPLVADHDGEAPKLLRRLYRDEKFWNVQQVRMQQRRTEVDLEAAGQLVRFRSELESRSSAIQQRWPAGAQ